MPTVASDEFKRVRNLDDIYALLDKLDIVNGWAKKEPSLYPLPKSSFVPAHWSYAPAHAALEAAGRFVNTELAERRNLILVNPLPGNTYPTVRTLVAAYQMVKAGETAKSHRHTANALRVVLDTRPGTYTIVDGKKIPMDPGDVLLTPNWCWHAHSNESVADAYWMDVLDVPTVHLLNPMFFEHHEAGIEPVSGIAADSPSRFPWADIARRLESATEIAPGRREIELGAPAMATVALHVTRLEAGATMTWPATTSSAIVAIMQGEGVSEMADKRFEWRRGDALASPSGIAHAVTAASEAYLLRASDEPLLRALGWLREFPQ